MRTEKPKDFKQFASGWGKKMYSSKGNKKETMKSSGCAPTAAADVVWELTLHRDVDPYEIAQLYVKKRFRRDGRGTLPSCFKWTAKYFGMRFRKLRKLDAVVSCLDAGGLVIAHMGQGYWTNGGHYICLWRYDGKYLYACDPGSSKRERQEAGQLVKECKGFYGFMEV